MIAWHWWLGFIGGTIVLLFADLFFLQRGAHAVRTKEAVWMSAWWIGISLAFAALVWVMLGAHVAGNYLTGYLIEKSLSADNLFVFVIIFEYFKVAPKYQHRVLFYGVLGAFVFRGIFIALGTTLLAKFSWIAFVFGGFLLFTSYRLVRHDGTDIDPAQNRVLRMLQRYLPVTKEMKDEHLFVRQDGRLAATPLFAVLVVIETTDIVFAVDSIPAVLAVTRNAFIVFSSNVCALLGLRALYFLLADMMDRFAYLDDGLAIILGIVGLKMIYEELVTLHQRGMFGWIPDGLALEIPSWMPLIVVVIVLSGAVALSLLWPPRHRGAAREVEASRR